MLGGFTNYDKGSLVRQTTVTTEFRVPRSVAASLRAAGWLMVVIAAGLLALSLSPDFAAASASASNRFPRVGAIWPNVSQDLDALAKFDYVMLEPTATNPWDSVRVAALRDRNPDLRVLTSTNAAEVRLAVVPSGENESRVSIHEVPNAWILRQLGSELTKAAQRSDTTLHVKDVTRFRKGDILVIGNELARVLSVGSGTLTVERGLYAGGIRQGAGSYKATTKLAAAVVFWPNSVVMDLTDRCPRVTVDPTAGPETWAEYSARRTAQMVLGGDWDGVFIDRCNSNVLINPVYTRSIDPNRNNIPVQDGYAALNASWNQGIEKYLKTVRDRVGDRIVVGNNAHPAHSLINGTVLEKAPRTTDTARDWLDRIMGSAGRTNHPGGRSYRDYLNASRKPNLTSLESYEVEASPTSGSTPSNPALTPGWKPNFRWMRFGLASSLMSDGYFVYSIGTFGHASLELMRFDEYDNAGTRVGYLGTARGAAKPALPPLATADLLKGQGAFATSAQLNKWDALAKSGYSIDLVRSSGTAKVTVGKTKGDRFGAYIYRSGLTLQKGVPYTITFRAKASSSREVYAYAYKRTSPWTNRARFGMFHLKDEWQQYSAVVKATSSDSNARLCFALGDKKGDIWIDDVKIQQGDRTAAHRRDFQYGVALVNPEAKSVTIPLGGLYKRLKGTQDPVTNNGAYVTSVTLQPQDGLILLRTSSLTVPASRTIKAGEEVTVTGTLKSVTGAVIGQADVVLQSSPDGKKWTPILSTKTLASGTYQFPAVKPKNLTYYRVWFNGDAKNFKGLSQTMTVKVKPVVGTPVAPSTARAGKAFSVYGSLKPVHTAGTKPVRVYKYKKVGTKWVKKGYVKATASDYKSYTRYKVKMKLTKGTWRLRAYAPADGQHVKAWSSKYRTVKVN